MLEQGALEEVKQLAKADLDRKLPAMKALGVPELLAYIDNKISLEEAVALAKLHTRQYAKRQLTWFRHKLKANFEINKCYQTDKNLIKNIIFNVKNEL